MRELLVVALIVIVLFAVIYGSGVEMNACTAAGRFPDTSVAACRGFIMCIAGAGGSFSQYNLTCPLDFEFDPTAGVCTDPANYSCPTSQPQVLFSCNRTGHFQNPDSADCRTYVLCSPASARGELIPRIFKCPEGHIFEPFEANCVNETTYKCGDLVVVETELSSPVTSSSVSTSISPSPLTFVGINAIVLMLL